MSACRRPYPDRIDGTDSLITAPSTSAFSTLRLGRLLHYIFRGLLSVHSRYNRQTRQVALCDPLHRRLRRLCCLHRRSDCYRVERSARSAGGISPPAAYRTVRKSLDLHGSSQTCTCPLAKANLRRTWMLLPVSWLAVTFFDLGHPLRSALITRASTLLQDVLSSSSALLLSPFMDSTYRVFA